MTAPLAGVRERLPAFLQPYLAPAPLAALALGVSSGFPYALIGATLTTRLAENGIAKSTVTAFSLAFLVYNLKFLWAPAVDRVRLPILGALGQRRSWLLLSAVLVALGVTALGLSDPKVDIQAVIASAIGLAVAGATFDIVIDAYRIELLSSRELGVGSGMSQYGWRIGSAGAGALALVVAQRAGWSLGYLACAAFVLPALVVTATLGEPERRREPIAVRGFAAARAAIWGPLSEFFRRRGAWLVLLFVLLHKIGDTLANLTLRLLFNDLGFTKDEIATYDVGFGFFAYLAGIFAGGIAFARMGLERSVMLSLLLMALSNLSFAALAAAGHSNPGLALAIGFENFSSGIGGVVVVAYLSALCSLSFTATQFALLSAAASIVGRFVTGTAAGRLIESMGFVEFYVFSTIAALPGVLLFAFLWRSGRVEASLSRDAT